MAEKITPEEYYGLNAQLIEISKKMFSGQIEVCTGYINKPEGVNIFDLPEIDLKNIALLLKDENGYHTFIPFYKENNGYYWVKIKDSTKDEWVVAQWVEGEWICGLKKYTDRDIVAVDRCIIKRQL